LDLEQHGTALCGEYSFNSANFGRGLVYLVTGNAAPPELTLTWNEAGTRRAMTGVLSSDGQSFSSTVSTNGGPPVAQASFRRAAQ